MNTTTENPIGYVLQSTVTGLFFDGTNFSAEFKEQARLFQAKPDEVFVNAVWPGAKVVPILPSTPQSAPIHQMLPKREYSRTILTGLKGELNREILESVIGQLSDGMWENNPSMRKYWEHSCIVVGEDGSLSIGIDDGFRSGFNGRSDEWIKNWFADKIKHIAKDESSSWDRKDTKTTLCYLSYKKNVTVADAYRAYDTLKGRKVKA